MSEAFAYEDLICGGDKRYAPVPFAILSADVDIDGETLKKGVYVRRVDGKYDHFTHAEAIAKGYL